MRIESKDYFLTDDLLNQAYQHYSASQPDLAVRLCRQILGVDPGRAEAVYLLAVIDNDAGRDSVAMEGFARAAALQPHNPVFINTWGESLHRLGRLDEAWSCYQRSIQLRPTYERAHNNSGRLLNQRGDQEGAMSCFNEAVRLNPNYATALNNLGGVLLTTSRSAAIPYLQRALALQPNYPEAHYNLASAFQADGEITKSLFHLDQAIRLRPNYPRAHLLLGKVLFEMGQVERSLVPFQTVVRLQPGDAVGHFELGTVQLLLNQLEPARQSFTTALQLDPSHKNAFAQLCRLNAMLMDWTNRDADLARLTLDVKACLSAGEASPIAPLHALPLPWTGEQILAIARNQAKTYTQSAARLRSARTDVGPARIHAGPLKIGYLSRDLYDHPVAHQIKGVFGLHDRSRFESHVYSSGPDDGSAYRRQIQESVSQFHDVSKLNDEQLIERLRADQIQILVDLMGYTGFAKTRCLAARPVPVQVSWLGFPSTMGADFIDYLIGDSIVTPPEHAHFYDEAIVRMPHSYMPTDHTQPVAKRQEDRSQFELPADVPVFCCFNNSYKITPEIFETWMSILRRVPDAVVWLNINHPTARENLRSAVRNSGIADDRLVFANHVADKASHLARLASADLFLDAPLYNAHSTGCDALWAGLPIVTCIGQTFQSRVAASLLDAVGLPELIARDLVEYEQITCDLINDRSRLKGLRKRLVEERQQLPLFDTPRFVHDLERAFLRMWEIHISGRPPESFNL